MHRQQLYWNYPSLFLVVFARIRRGQRWSIAALLLYSIKSGIFIARAEYADLRSDGGRGHVKIARYHEDADACLATRFDHACNPLARLVNNAHHAEHAQVLDFFDVRLELRRVRRDVRDFHGLFADKEDPLAQHAPLVLN